jgi:arylsulfatase A-like enzyme
MPIIGMLKSAATLEQKTSHMINLASTFDQNKVLQQLKTNSINKNYYLFDEHLEMAIVDQNSFPAFKTASTASVGSGFNFDDADESVLVFHKAEHKIKDGICFIKSSPGSFITNAQELSLSLAGLSVIEIRLKAKQGKELLLGLSSKPDAQWSERDKIVKEVRDEAFTVSFTDICTVPLTIIPDNTFHTYSINIESKLATAWVTFDDKVRKFFISPPEIPGNDIEIDYIRFVTKKEKFSRTPFGETYIEKNREFRRVLYMNTPGRLRYTITIPPTTPYLSFGTGVLMPGDPVEFMVSLKSDDYEKVIFRETGDDPNVWSFTKLDLADYAGKTVDVIFSTSSRQGNIAFWSNPVLYTLPQERLNVIIVLEDALRADHLSLYGYTARETSPFLEKFARAGVVFEYAFSQATSTRPSCPSFMTSLFPTAAGVGLNHETLSENYLTLAEIMRSQGYATAAINQNLNAGYYNGLHQGFSRLYDLKGHAGKRSTADVYGNQLISWLDDIQGRNFFLYLHIMAPHAPYNPPPPFDAWYHEAHLSGETLAKNHSDPKWMEKPTQEGRRLLYDGAVRSNDHWFEKFHKMLASRNLLQNTLIVFISDHGEHLGERDAWGHKPPGYIQGIRVPLVMVYPKKLPSGKRIKTPVQLIDIMPTILDIAGINKDELVLQGDSLLTLIDGSRPDFWASRICFSEEVINRSYKFDDRPFGSLFVGNWHMLNSKEFLPSKLRNEQSRVEPFFFKAFQFATDPGEARFMNSFYFDPVAKIIAARVMKNFHNANQQLCKAFTGQEKGAIKIDPLVQERLLELGYLQ